MLFCRDLFAVVRRLVLLAFVALLASCATPPGIQGVPTDHAFQRNGRFAVTVDEVGQPTQAVQGGFAWYDSGAQLILDLVNPLGSALARVEVFPGRAILRRTDGTAQEAQDADTLVAQVLGATVPVSGLRAWLQGKVDSALAVNIRAKADGAVSGFSQQGWVVVLSRHDAHGPRLLQLALKEGLRSISVRLVIDAP